MIAERAPHPPSDNNTKASSSSGPQVAPGHKTPPSHCNFGLFIIRGVYDDGRTRADAKLGPILMRDSNEGNLRIKNKKYNRNVTLSRATIRIAIVVIISLMLFNDAARKGE